MGVDSEVKQVPFFSDAVYGRRVKRRYIVWLLMVVTLAAYLLSEPLTSSSIRRLAVLPIYWGGIVFVGGWLYDIFWKGRWGRLEIQTRWFVWWFISLWATLAGTNPWPMQAAFYGIIVGVVGTIMDGGRKRRNKRLLFHSLDGVGAIIYTSPHQAYQFPVGERLKQKGKVLVVTEVGFNYVYAEAPQQ